MTLPPHHQRRLHRHYGLTFFFLWFLRNPRLQVEPPERCRTYVLGALSEPADPGSN